MMKANEFVRKFGWGNSKSCLAGITNRDLASVGICGEYANIGDLKRLVESHELVCDCGGLEDAKSHLDSITFNITTKTWFGQALLNWSMYADKLEKAIADVESCQ